MENETPTHDSPVTFFGLTFLLSLPFYIFNGLAQFRIVGQPEMGALYIACFTVTPATAASILRFHRHGNRGLKELFGRVFDFKRVAQNRWYVVILFLAPLLHLLSLGGLGLYGASFPPAFAPLVALPILIPFFFLLAAGEEVGWMGYAFEPLQTKYGALRAALILGMVWEFWHVPFFVFMMPDPVVFSAQLLTLVGTRVLVAWVFNNTGKSVFAAILFHAADNTAFVTLPEVKAIIIPWGAAMHCCIVLIAAIIVAFLWGPRTLARYRCRN